MFREVGHWADSTCFLPPKFGHLMKGARFGGFGCQSPILDSRKIKWNCHWVGLILPLHNNLNVKHKSDKYKTDLTGTELAAAALRGRRRVPGLIARGFMSAGEV